VGVLQGVRHRHEYVQIRRDSELSGPYAVAVVWQVHASICSSKENCSQGVWWSLTIEEFRACFGTTPPSVEFPNQVQLQQKVGAVSGAPVISDSNSKSKLKAIDDSSGLSESLKLKRDKPLERSKSKLESALGITRKAK
jgi:hypothetical protein